MARTTVSTTALLLFLTPRPSETHLAIRWVCARAPDARRSEAPVPFRPGSPAKTKKSEKLHLPPRNGVIPRLPEPRSLTPRRNPGWVDFWGKPAFPQNFVFPQNLNSSLGSFLSPGVNLVFHP